MKRSKSQPARFERKAEIQVINDEKMEKRLNKMKKKGKTAVISTLDNRPPFNLDTKIEGYDDIDENGRIRKRWDAASSSAPLKSKIDQEKLTSEWTNGLRSGFH
ncbi:unnamed protein product [Auanema sp. JU1783]|nr:unnamed protein product [Auanema sp. JU1783]